MRYGKMKLLETREVLNDMITNSIYYNLSHKQKEAIERALEEVEITIDNGDPGNW